VEELPSVWWCIPDHCEPEASEGKCVMSALKNRIIVAAVLTVCALSLSGCVQTYIPGYVGMT